MGNKRHTYGPKPSKTERVVTPALQLGFGVEVKRDQAGNAWLGLTFGQGTLSFTLAIPAENKDQFVSMIADSVSEAWENFQKETPVGQGLLVPQSQGLILPGNN